MRVGEEARMTQPAKSQEPSMEEILASIRRIIADDDATKSTPKPAEMAKPAPSPPRPVTPPRPPSPAPRVPDPSLAAEAAPFEEQPVVEPPAAYESADILDLTESMATQPPPETAAMPSPAFRTIDGSFDISYDEEADKPALQRPVNESASLLLSSATSAAVDSAFNSLAQTVLVQNARTLEDLVREMLRPMLKAWLDDNLPGMVERLVRAEIERVSRGRTG
jgi:cell pole-organizing protein PopZ